MKKQIPLFTALIFMMLISAANLFSENGTAWGPGAFRSNGERIYFTATSERGTQITYRGGVSMGMMMMRGRLACVSCHGPGARGGRHVMHMAVMDAPDIRWTALSEEEKEEGEHGRADEKGHSGYTFEMFKMAVIYGKHPDGKPLKREMPRWKMSDEDLMDLANFLKSLP